MTLVDAETGEVVAPTFEWPAGVHPAADLFPMLGREDFGKLVADIAENGLLEPIWLDAEGRLLDGRNRLAACQRAGVAPRTRTYDGDNAVEFVLSLNVHRRHLTPGQLAVVALEALPLFEAQARGRMSDGGKGVPAGAPFTKRAANEAGEAVGVSGRSVARVKRVADEAPELIDKIKSGEMSMRTADAEVVSRKRQAIIDGTTKTSVDDPERIERITKMAGEGHNSRQIGEALGVSDGYVRILARRHGIELQAEKVMGRTRNIDSNRVVAQVVLDAAGIVAGLDLINYEDLDPTELDGWVSSLSASIKSLTTVKNKLSKELTRVQQ